MSSLDLVKTPRPVWIGFWLADAFGFERGPAVRLEATTVHQLRELAESQGLPWTVSPA